MTVRSLVASVFIAGHLAAGGASAQVLLCPEAPPLDIAVADTPAEAERLLKRLTIALDLHGHRGISEQEILDAHADTPTALLGKLSNVVERCVAASSDLEGFHDALPDLRKAFLEATNVPEALDAAQTVDADDEAAEARAIRTSTKDWAEAERVEESIDLSVRELWRKLWFRSADNADADANRWAVIVASPPDADQGWDELGEHQHRWVDTYFQLHEPYYESNPHHAIVVGRRLPRAQALRLRDYVIELGMADDAYIWALPEEGAGIAERGSVLEAQSEGDDPSGRSELDLTGLD